MLELLDNSLSYSGAVLIGYSTELGGDRASVFAEVGIQQPNQNRRFANVALYDDDVTLYFKHDPATIAEYFRRYPEILSPSDVAPRYWSKLRIRRSPDGLAESLLRRSYDLVRASLTKRGRALLERLDTESNNFLHFHEAALELSRHPRVFVSYSDWREPVLVVDGQPVVRFEYNNVAVHLGGTWVQIRSSDQRTWRVAMSKAIADAAPN